MDLLYILGISLLLLFLIIELCPRKKISGGTELAVIEALEDKFFDGLGSEKYETYRERLNKILTSDLQIPASINPGIHRELLEELCCSFTRNIVEIKDDIPPEEKYTSELFNKYITSDIKAIFKRRYPYEYDQLFFKDRKVQILNKNTREDLMTTVVIILFTQLLLEAYIVNSSTRDVTRDVYGFMYLMLYYYPLFIDMSLLVEDDIVGITDMCKLIITYILDPNYIEVKNYIRPIDYVDNMTTESILANYVEDFNIQNRPTPMAKHLVKNELKHNLKQLNKRGNVIFNELTNLGATNYEFAKLGNIRNRIQNKLRDL